MAYFGDPAQIKIINFIPVRMVGSQHPSAQRGSLSALGLGPRDYSYAPPAIQHPYALMSICDAQRHLVAAGKLPRSGVDGAWGQQSKNALLEFVKTMPLAAVRAVYTDNQNRGNVPPLGSREDYKLVGRDQIRIPQAYVMAFPAKASVRCGAAPAVTPDSVPPSPQPPTPDQPPPGSTPPAPDSPVVDDSEQGGAGAAKSGPPWGLIGAAAAVVVVAGLLMYGRRQERSA
jgi:hypothetical protein